MKKVKISGFLGYGSKIVRYLDEQGYRERNFISIKRLVDYYGLIEVKKTSIKEWAINSRGLTIQWNIYTAMMPIN